MTGDADLLKGDPYRYELYWGYLRWTFYRRGGCITWLKQFEIAHEQQTLQHSIRILIYLHLVKPRELTSLRPVFQSVGNIADIHVVVESYWDFTNGKPSRIAKIFVSEMQTASLLSTDNGIPRKPLECAGCSALEVPARRRGGTVMAWDCGTCIRVAATAIWGSTTTTTTEAATGEYASQWNGNIFGQSLGWLLLWY